MGIGGKWKHQRSVVWLGWAALICGRFATSNAGGRYQSHRAPKQGTLPQRAKETGLSLGENRELPALRMMPGTKREYKWPGPTFISGHTRPKRADKPLSSVVLATLTRKLDTVNRPSESRAAVGRPSWRHKFWGDPRKSTKRCTIDWQAIVEPLTHNVSAVRSSMKHLPVQSHA